MRKLFLWVLMLLQLHILLKSASAAEGHIANSGQVFFMNGCDIGKRSFMSRTFTITTP